MNLSMYRAFSEELVKIAVLGAVARGFKSALKAGWNDSGGYMGSGKITKYLPIGGKGLTLAGAAMEAPSVMAKEDPSGAGRGRLERGLNLAGNVGGGLAGMGAGQMAANHLMRGRTVGAKAGKFLGGAGSIVGGIAGSMIAPHLLTAPSRMLREHQQRAQMAQQQPTDPVSGYGS